jgi:hypothetical protein
MMSHLNVNKQFNKMNHAYCILIGGKHLNRQPGLLLPIFYVLNRSLGEKTTKEILLWWFRWPISLFGEWKMILHVMIFGYSVSESGIDDGLCVYEGNNSTGIIHRWGRGGWDERVLIVHYNVLPTITGYFSMDI